MSERKKPRQAFCPHTLSKCPCFERILWVSDVVSRLQSDIRWIKWLLIIILTALVGTAVLL